MGRADIVRAIGIGIWAASARSRAARQSLTDQQASAFGNAPDGQAALWLAASGGLFLLAVGPGFTLDVTDKKKPGSLLGSSRQQEPPHCVPRC